MTTLGTYPTTLPSCTGPFDQKVSTVSALPLFAVWKMVADAHEAETAERTRHLFCLEVGA